MQSHHHQRVHYPCLLKLHLLKKSIKIHRYVVNTVVMWLHVLVGPCWFVCMLHCSAVVYCPATLNARWISNNYFTYACAETFKERAHGYWIGQINTEFSSNFCYHWFSYLQLLWKQFQRHEVLCFCYELFFYLCYVISWYHPLPASCCYREVTYDATSYTSSYWLTKNLMFYFDVNSNYFPGLSVR